MPFFWFVSFTNGIKRIKDKTFCFDVRLGLNPCTRHTSCIHRVGCNSEEMHGIRMSKVLPLLLGKQATIGSLSQNLFCHLQGNGEWLTILESFKKEKEKKKTRVLLRVNPTNNKKDIVFVVSLRGSCLKLLRVTYSSSFSLLSLPFLVRLLPRVDLGLFLYHYLYLFLPCLHILFQEDMCTSCLDWWAHWRWWKLAEE